MPELNTFLNKVHIENYLSLRDVELPLKPLTVLVGANASGKSNVLRALRLLKGMIAHEEPPPVHFIQDAFWAGEAKRIAFQLQARIEDTPTIYGLDLKAEADYPFVTERLSVDDVQVISIQSGEGEVKDENGKTLPNTNPIN